MGREGRDYWVEQLAEYWESGLTIQEYSDLKVSAQRFGSARFRKSVETWV